MNAVLIVNEAIYLVLGRNRGAILCKLDLEKVYDHVDWSFCSVMSGVSPHLVFQSLLMGLPMGFSSSSRGLRQGILSHPIFL